MDGWALVDEHQSVIRKAARRFAYAPVLTADDLFQIAAIRVAQYSGDWPTPQRAPGLVYRIAQRACVDAHRKELGRHDRSRRAGRSVEVSIYTVINPNGQTLEDIIPDPSIPSPADRARRLDADALRRRLRGILATMEYRHAVCLTEKYISGRKNYEIAAFLGVDQSAITHMMRRALKEMRRRVNVLAA